VKWVLLVLAVAGAVVGAVAVIGFTLPESHVISRSAELSVPPDTVWSIITNIAEYPKWRKDVERVEQISGTPHLSWREFSGHDKMTYEATTVEPTSHFVSRIADKGLGFGGSWDYSIEPHGKGSKITITEEGKIFNPIFRFVSEYVIGQTATLDKYLTALTTRTGDKYTPGAA
jgi:uncharacterized protein YndB with AHSA1/START domain